MEWLRKASSKRLEKDRHPSDNDLELNDSSTRVSSSQGIRTSDTFQAGKDSFEDGQPQSVPAPGPFRRRMSAEDQAGAYVPPVDEMHFSTSMAQRLAKNANTPRSIGKSQTPRSVITVMMDQSKVKKPPSNPNKWPHSTEEDIKKRPYRVVKFNQDQDFSFCSNLIITSKYTVLSFLPLFLFASFSPKKKMANVYFLLLSIAQCIPAISNTFGLPTVLLPLSFVIFVDGIFEALEDIRRHKADAAANSSPCHIFDNQTGQWEKKSWVDIQVGDLLMVKNREVVPADLVLLSVCESDPRNPDGICYLETKSLDGETNLKLRETLDCTLGKVACAEDAGKLIGMVEMEHPNKLIDSFTGTIEVVDAQGKHTKEVIQPVNVLLRGCIVRNTEWVCGLVANTGNDTKIMMSNVDAPAKSSSMTLLINVEIKRIVLLLVVVCIIGAAGFVIGAQAFGKHFGYNSYLDKPEWAERNASTAVQLAILQFFYFFLLCGSFIPVSLYVSMSTIRFFQSYFMEQDLEMYYEPADHHAEVRTMNLNEELGQISHVFTDKTGTLTCNVMEFRKCTVGGLAYGLGVTEISKSYRRMTGLPLSQEEMRAELESRKSPQAAHVNFYDPIFWQDLNHCRRGDAQRKRIEDFFRVLSVCHSVIPEKDEKTGDVKYSASSPDDEALVCAGKYFGFAFEGRRDGAALIRNTKTNQLERYRVLEILEFTSARKRMTVIVEAPNGEIELFAKGADSAMIPRLKKGQDSLVETTLEHMKRFASEGLRTLMICHGRMRKEEFARWYMDFDRASKDLRQIELRKDGKDNAIDDLMDRIEANFELLGATAIEDKLQEGVPETIYELSRAGIKVWMLTGDKEETAVNIGVACNLLDQTNKTRRITINSEKCENEQQIRYLIKEELRRFKEDVEKQQEMVKPRSLVIDGPSLILASKDAVRRRLLKLTRVCKSVVACRVSPDQKRSIVEMVKRNEPGCRALCIGDGANDVPMIQEAHVGVGIAGQEGMQAVNASDYAVSQFRFLRSLMLAHGRWNYRRMSLIVAYIFYKNILQAIANYYFAFTNGFSGQKLFTEGSIQLYNILFTTLPLLLVGMWDRDVSYQSTLKYPELYTPGIHNHSFNSPLFWKWIVAAMVESVAVVLFPLYALRTVFVYNGPLSTFWEAGAVTYTIILLLVDIKLAVRQQRWNMYNFWAYVLSLLLWFAVGFGISNLVHVDYNWYKLFEGVMASPGCWMVIFVITMFFAVPDVFVVAYKRAFHPDLKDLVQALEKGLVTADVVDEAVKDAQASHLKAVSGGVPSVTPASGGTPIEAMRRFAADAGMMSRKTTGFAFSADPITLEAERRRIMFNSARLAPLRDILIELEMEESEWPEDARKREPSANESDSASDGKAGTPSPAPADGGEGGFLGALRPRDAALRILEAELTPIDTSKKFTLGGPLPKVGNVTTTVTKAENVVESPTRVVREGSRAVSAVEDAGVVVVGGGGERRESFVAAGGGGGVEEQKEGGDGVADGRGDSSSTSIGESEAHPQPDTATQDGQEQL